MRRVADWLAVLTGWALLLYCFAVAFEIIGRRYLGFSLQGVDEYGGYLMALIVAVGFTVALYSNAHIRIDMLLPRLPCRLTLWLHVAALASIAGFAAFLVWQGAGLLAQSHKLQAVSPTPLLTPLVIPQAIWLSGLTFFLLAAGVFLLQLLRQALRGDAERVAEMVGGPAGRPPKLDARP
jgi:TRAP-type C4-dicarboxylate transport system permease small subunit